MSFPANDNKLITINNPSYNIFKDKKSAPGCLPMAVWMLSSRFLKLVICLELLHTNMVFLNLCKLGRDLEIWVNHRNGIIILL